MKKPGKHKKRKPVKRKAAEKTFLARLRDAFVGLFKAPAESLRKKRGRRLAREIKAKGYSPSYEKRLLRAVESGKATTLQQARGHKPGEARVRAEREIAEQGLTSAQIRSIKTFHQRWLTNRGKEDFVSEDAMIEYAQENGYDAFGRYRKAWTALRREYLRDQDDGTYLPRPGLLDLIDATNTLSVPTTQFLFYH